jgi:hypothetical protein
MLSTTAVSKRTLLATCPPSRKFRRPSHRQHPRGLLAYGEAVERVTSAGGYLAPIYLNSSRTSLGGVATAFACDRLIVMCCRGLFNWAGIMPLPVGTTC